MFIKYSLWLWLLMPCFCLQTNEVLAQEQIVTEEIFSLGMQLGFGARAIAMGGATSSVGGGYSSSYWNPAGLHYVERIEVYGSLSHLVRNNDFGLTADIGSFNPSGRSSEENFTKFNDIGIAYPLPTVRGALVFSFGFNRVKSYDSNFDFRAFNSTPGDSVDQSWREFENGGINVWTMAGAVDVSPNVTLGLGLNFWSGERDFESTFKEFDTQNNFTVFPDDWDSSALESTVKDKISGFNVKVGGLFRLGNLLNLGLTIATPTTFKVEEDWSDFEETIFDDDTFADTTISGVIDYKIRSPWTFTSGASLHLLNLVVSGDLEYNDWSQIRYKTDPPFVSPDGGRLTKTKVNGNIRDNYRATARIRLGAELSLPPTGLSLRAGYFRDPSIFQNATTDEDKQFISAGVGFRFDKQVTLDVALVHGFWKQLNSDLIGTSKSTTYVEDIKVNKIFVSLALRL